MTNPHSVGAEPGSHFLPCKECNESSLLTVCHSSVTVDYTFFYKHSHSSFQ